MSRMRHFAKRAQARTGLLKDIDPSVASIALEAMDPQAFEIFGQVVLSEALGTEFEPTGGTQDGGQDGFLRVHSGRPGHYVQISKEKDVRGKVRRTINRLNESGRPPTALTFLTSESFSTRDEFEAEIQKATGVQTKIYDRSWLILQITKNDLVRSTFAQRASGALRSANEVTSATIQRHTPAERMSVIVYMDAHARSSPQQTDLLTVAADAAIYQALEGTDPDKGIFKNRAEVTNFVYSRFPAIKRRPSLNIGVRLERLSEKKNNPRIRWHKKEDKYCLPFDVRNELSQENEAVKRLEIDFLESVRSRVAKIMSFSDESQPSRVAQAVLGALVRTFEQQGMNLAASFESKDSFDEVKTYAFISDEISGHEGDNSNRGALIECASQALREVVYSGTELERSYLFQLFKLYSVEFVMKGDDRVTSHFKSMAKSLRLVVGADIIIRALSETCVQPESRATQNVLALLDKAGSTLLLTPQILEEVYTHIIAENKEYDGHYQPWVNHVTPIIARQIDRILIRAFFYSKFYPERHAISVSGWRNFLDQIGAAAWFDDRRHLDDFGAFLAMKFKLTYLPAAEVGKGVSDGEVRRFKTGILARRETAGRRDTSEVLAENDARAALYVNHYRETHGERIGTSVYGYSTWWLTEEFQVVQVAEDLRIPSKFAMNPQFLMNFFVASPALRQITADFGAFFPTTFGLRITDRVSEKALRDFLRRANEAAKQDEAVAGARIRKLSNELMGERYSKLDSVGRG